MHLPVVDVPCVVRVLERAEGLLEVGLGRGQAAQNENGISRALQFPLKMKTIAKTHHATIMVLAFPPSESCSSRVSLDSR